MANKKIFKTQISNPAMQFISNPPKSPLETVAKEITKEEIPQGYKIDHRYIETRSKRMQILITKSLHEKLKSKAELEGRSVNDLINILLEEKFK